MWKYVAYILIILFLACSQVISQSQKPSPSSTPALQESNPSPSVAPKSKSSGDTSGNPAGPGDPKNYVGEIYKIGLGWHPAALQGLPKDKYGLADWVEMMKKKLINPKGNLDFTAEDAPLDMEIVMPAKTGLIEGAYFPHSTHTWWLNCETCHDKIFIPEIGANNLTMSRIVKGEACGVCHGKVAFPLNDCERCHRPKSGVSKTPTAK